jgi:hypothetical protein
MSSPATTWSPVSSIAITQCTAAMPLENASAPHPPSSDANVVSSALRVGLPLRE